MSGPHCSDTVSSNTVHQTSASPNSRKLKANLGEVCGHPEGRHIGLQHPRPTQKLHPKPHFSHSVPTPLLCIRVVRDRRHHYTTHSAAQALPDLQRSTRAPTDLPTPPFHPWSSPRYHPPLYIVIHGGHHAWQVFDEMP